MSHNTKMFPEDVLDFCWRPRYIRELEKKFKVETSTVYLRLDDLILHGKMRKFRTDENEMWQYIATPEGNPNVLDMTDPFYMAVVSATERLRCKKKSTRAASVGKGGTGLSKPPKKGRESNAGVKA